MAETHPVCKRCKSVNVEERSEVLGPDGRRRPAASYLVCTYCGFTQPVEVVCGHDSTTETCNDCGEVIS